MTGDGGRESGRFLADDEATSEFARELSRTLAPGDVLLLEGPLGAGKTSLVRGLVAALGGDPAEVCSPTFTLLDTYDVRSGGGIRRVHHADLYRLRGRPRAPLDEVGLGEALDDGAAIVAIEWPEQWPALADAARRVVRVELRYDGEGRRVEVSGTNGLSA